MGLTSLTSLTSLMSQTVAWLVANARWPSWFLLSGSSVDNGFGASLASSQWRDSFCQRRRRTEIRWGTWIFLRGKGWGEAVNHKRQPTWWLATKVANAMR